MPQRTVNSFFSGMVKDLDRKLQESGAYFNSLNGRILYNEQDGTYAWQNLPGAQTEATIQPAHGCFNDFTSAIVIGSCEFPDYTVLFLSVTRQGFANTFSEIGRISHVAGAIVYETMFFDGFAEALLNYNVTNPIEAIPVVENIQHERVYYTDDLNKPRVFDIQKALDDSSNDGANDFYAPDNCAGYSYPANYSTHKHDLQPEFNPGIMKFMHHIPGSLKSGVYQYTYRMVSAEGVKSEFYPLSTHVVRPDLPKNTTDSGKYYMRDVGVTSSHGHRLMVKGVDTRFEFIEFAYAYSESSTAPPIETNIIGQFDVQANLTAAAIPTVEFDHPSNGGQPILADEIVAAFSSVQKAKTIKTKGNRLWLGNIEETRELKLTDAQIQNITVSPIYKNIQADDTGRVADIPLVHTNLIENESFQLSLFAGHNESYLIQDDYQTYKGAQVEHTLKGYWRGETYRFGIVFFDKFGKPNVVQHLFDITFPEQYEDAFTVEKLLSTGLTVTTNGVSTDSTVTSHAGKTNPQDLLISQEDTLGVGPSIAENSTFFNTARRGLVKLKIQGLQISNIDISSIRNEISGYAIVRTERDPKTIAQGVFTNAKRGKYGRGYGFDDMIVGGGQGNAAESGDGETFIDDLDSVMAPPADVTYHRRLDTYYEQSLTDGGDNEATGFDSNQNKFSMEGRKSDIMHQGMYQFQTNTTLATARNQKVTRYNAPGDYKHFNGRSTIYNIMHGVDHCNHSVLNPGVAPNFGTYLMDACGQMGGFLGLFDVDRAVRNQGRPGVQHITAIQNHDTRPPLDMNHDRQAGGFRRMGLIQTKLNWYYLGCPDYLLTSESEQTIFPWMTIADVDDDGASIGTYSDPGGEPPGGLKVKLVGKLQGAYKESFFLTSDGTDFGNITTYNTALHNALNYGKTYSRNNSDIRHDVVDDNQHYVPSKFYTKHYNSFRLDYDTASPEIHASWAMAGSCGVMLNDDVDVEQYLISHGLPAVENQDYVGAGIGTNLQGKQHDWCYRLINNKHTLGLTTEIQTMIEAGGLACQDGGTRKETVRQIPAYIDSDFDNKNLTGVGVIYNYSIFYFGQRNVLGPIYYFNKRVRNGLGNEGEMDDDGTLFFPDKDGGWVPGLQARDNSGNLYEDLSSEPNNHAGGLFRPAPGIQGDTEKNLARYHQTPNNREENCTYKSNEASNPTSARYRTGVGHNGSLYLRLPEWNFIGAHSHGHTSPKDDREGTHADVWFISNIGYPEKTPYGGLNSATISTKPFYFTGTFVPVNNQFNTPNVVNNTEVFGGDCFLTLFDLSRIHPHNKGHLGHKFYTRCEPSWTGDGRKNACHDDVFNAFVDIMEGNPNSTMAAKDVCQHGESGYGVGMIFPIESDLNHDLRNAPQRLSSHGHQTHYDWIFNHPKYKPEGLHFNWDCSYLADAAHSPKVDYRFQIFELADVTQHEETFRFYTLAEKEIATNELPFDFPTRWLWSEYKNYGEQVDSFRKFPISQFFDLDGQYGEVWGSVYLFDEIFSIQESAFAKLRVDERAVLTGSDDLQVVIGNPNVMNGVDYISTVFGTQSQFSAVVTDAAAYWVDARKGKFLRYQGARVEALSDIRGMHLFFNNLKLDYYNTSSNDSHTFTTGIHAGYDKRNSDVYITGVNALHNESGESNFTVVYNEKLDVFTTFIGAQPQNYYTLGSSIYYTGNSRGVNEFNTGDYGSYPGLTANSSSELTFLVNESPQYTKTFDSISFNMNNSVPLMSSLSLSAETSDQIGGPHLLNPAVDTRARYRENLFKLPTRELGRADRVRGQSMKVTATFNGGNQLVRITTAETNYRFSNRR